MFAADTTILLVVDVQGKLAHLMHNKDFLFQNIQKLIKTAQCLEIPIIFTEQVPNKIGKTISEVAQILNGQTPIEKSSFSCCGEEKFIQSLRKFNRKQIILTGIETHVCIYQTTSDLLNLKYEVQVVSDAVSSRTQENKILALEKIKSRGAGITSTEMIICELLQTAMHPKFKEIIQLIK